mgnify:CR=1 FL=1
MEKGVEIDFLNSDLVDVFMAVEVNENNIDYLKKTNWPDLREHFENHSKDKRAERIYNDFSSLQSLLKMLLRRCFGREKRDRKQLTSLWLNKVGHSQCLVNNGW